MSGSKVQFFACWTDVDIALSLIAELVSTKVLGSVVHIRDGNVGANSLLFDGNQIVFGTVLLVASDLPRPEFPAEARAPKQVEHQLPSLAAHLALEMPLPETASVLSPELVLRPLARIGSPDMLRHKSEA